MMTKKKTSRLLGVKFVLTLPVLALLLFAFAEPSYKVKDVEATNSEISILEVKSETKLTIQGKVFLKETGDPLPGTTIVIKGSGVGTVVDGDGTFTLIDPSPKVKNDGGFQTTIVVSFVGLRTIEKTLGISGQNPENQENITVVFNMEESIVGIGRAEQLIPIKKDPPPPPPPAPISNGDEEVFYIVEDMPNYPGGSTAINNYVYKMQKKIADAKKVKGKAKVMFTVNKTGKVTAIKIVEKDNDGAAKGAYSIVAGMQDWSPGKQRGKAVPVKYLLPVEFK